MNDISELTEYDPARYDGWTLDDITGSLRGASLNLLKRGSSASLIARREWGGMLVAASKLVTTVVEQTQLFRRILDLAYNAARMHMKLWVHWPRVAKMLQDREESCSRRGVPFVVPGYKSCLLMTGVAGRMGPAIPLDPSPPIVFGEQLPTDVAALTERVEALERQNRLEHEKSTRLIVELDEAKKELDELRTEKTETPPESGWLHKLTGWFAPKLPRITHQSQPDRQSEIEIRIGNCLAPRLLHSSTALADCGWWHHCLGLNSPADAGVGFFGNGKRAVLGLPGFGCSTPLLERETPDGRNESAAPPRDRGHDGPQSVAGDERSYVHAVAWFGGFFGRSPDKLNLEDVRAFQVHLVAGGISAGAEPDRLRALRFLYGFTLKQTDLPERIPYAREPRRLPVVLGADEVVRFLEAVPSLKARVALTTAYAAGLRASQAANLKVANIDSSRT